MLLLSYHRVKVFLVYSVKNREFINEYSINHSNNIQCFQCNNSLYSIVTMSSKCEIPTNQADLISHQLMLDDRWLKANYKMVTDPDMAGLIMTYQIILDKPTLLNKYAKAQLHVIMPFLGIFVP